MRGRCPTRRRSGALAPGPRNVASNPPARNGQIALNCGRAWGVTGGEMPRDDEVPANRRPVAADDPRVRELYELVSHVRVLTTGVTPRSMHPAGNHVAAPAPADASAPAYPAVSTQDVLDEVDRMEAELRATARSNSETAEKSKRRWAGRGLIERCLVALVVVAGLGWVADAALGYQYAKPAQLRVVAAGRGARVEVPHHGYQLIDCWATGSVENVYKVAPPFDRLVPYRCGDGIAAVLVPGAMSVFALGAVFFGTLVLLWSWWRRRRGTWY